MKRRLVWYITICVLFLASGFAGTVILATAPDAGLSSVHTIDDLKRHKVRIEWAQGDPVDGMAMENVLVNDFTKNKEKYVSELSSSDIVVVAKATGKIEVTNGTIGQEIIVSTVLQGEEHIAADSVVMVWDDYGLQVLDGQIVYRNVLNLMQPSNEYLLFLNANTLNSIQKDKHFNLASTFFGYCEIPFEKEEVLRDNNRVAKYSDWIDYPSFISSEEIAIARSEIYLELCTFYGLE